MKQIKTIFYKIDFYEKFDKEVNEALADGWTLTGRMVIPAQQPDRFTLLLAELEREDIPKEGLRCCENCGHFHCSPQQEPCHSCEIVNNTPNKWEPAT